MESALFSWQADNSVASWSSNRHQIFSAGSYHCKCLEPPPIFSIPKPPNPVLFIRPNTHVSGNFTQDFTNPVCKPLFVEINTKPVFPVSDMGLNEFRPLEEYVIFTLTAGGACLLCTVVTVLALLYCRRRGKCSRLLGKRPTRDSCISSSSSGSYPADTRYWSYSSMTDGMPRSQTLQLTMTSPNGTIVNIESQTDKVFRPTLQYITAVRKNVVPAPHHSFSHARAAPKPDFFSYKPVSEQRSRSIDQMMQTDPVVVELDFKPTNQKAELNETTYTRLVASDHVDTVHYLCSPITEQLQQNSAHIYEEVQQQPTTYGRPGSLDCHVIHVTNQNRRKRRRRRPISGYVLEWNNGNCVGGIDSRLNFGRRKLPLSSYWINRAGSDGTRSGSISSVVPDTPSSDHSIPDHDFIRNRGGIRLSSSSSESSVSSNADRSLEEQLTFNEANPNCNCEPQLIPFGEGRESEQEPTVLQIPNKIPKLSRKNANHQPPTGSASVAEKRGFDGGGRESGYGTESRYSVCTWDSPRSFRKPFIPMGEEQLQSRYRSPALIGWKLPRLKLTDQSQARTVRIHSDPMESDWCNVPLDAERYHHNFPPSSETV